MTANERTERRMATMRWIDIIIGTIRMKRIKQLEKRLCKAVSKFMGENIVCVLSYGEKDGDTNV